MRSREEGAVRARMFRVLLAGTVVAGLASAATSPAAAGARPSLSWVRANPATSPPGRHYSVMAYDAGSSQMVVFSGEMGAGPPQVADTWTWDGSTWSQATPATSPPARQGATMAYDAATGQLILFGGETGTDSGLLNDTWTWDGTNWRQLAPATSPPPRYDASMAYDPATGKLVLFGGFGAAYNSDDLNDTWIWNGSTWSQATPATSPPVRVTAGLAYDPANGGLVLFGGIGPAPPGQPAPPSAFLGGTWIWNGTTWTKQHPAASPPARSAAVMAYDQATGQDILFGGTGSNGSGRNDTWAWDGSTWTQVTTSASPPPRSAAAMAYDGASKQVVLFSGWNGFEQPGTWNLGVTSQPFPGPSSVPSPAPSPGPPATGCSLSTAAKASGARPHLITVLATPATPPASPGPYLGSYCVVAEVLDSAGDPVADVPVTFEVTSPAHGGFDITRSTSDVGGAAVIVPSSGSTTKATLVHVFAGSVSTSVGVTEQWLMPSDRSNAVVGVGVGGQNISWPTASAAQAGLCYSNAYLTTTRTARCQRVYQADGWGNSGRPVTMAAASTTFCQAFKQVTTLVSCGATALTPLVCVLPAELTGPVACAVYISQITELGLPVTCAEALAGALGDAITADTTPSAAISMSDISTIEDITTAAGAGQATQDAVAVACDATVPHLALSPAQIPAPAPGTTTTQVTLSLTGANTPDAVAELMFTPGFGNGGGRAAVDIGGNAYPLSATPTWVVFDAADDPITITYTYPTSALYREASLHDVITAVPAGSLTGTIPATATYTSSGPVPRPCGPTICSSATAMRAGQMVSVSAAGFRPGSRVTFVIESSPLLLGRAAAGSSRVARFSFTVPGTLTPGVHVLSATGYAGNGDQLITRTIDLTVLPGNASARSLTAVIAVVAALSLALALIAALGGIILWRRRARAGTTAPPGARQAR